jgi:hypothetical protein
VEELADWTLTAVTAVALLSSRCLSLQLVCGLLSSLAKQKDKAL